MAHSSQVTMNEYADKHQPENTRKLASLWEEKMNGGANLQASPVSSVNSPVRSIRNTKPLPTAEPIQSTTEQASDALQKKKTRDIITNFEKMASSDDSVPTPISLENRDDKSAVGTKAKYEKTNGSTSREELRENVRRVTSCLSELNKAVDQLKSRMDHL